MSNQPSGAPLTPTFHGFIACTMDACVLFEAALTGVISHVPRRPHDRERGQLIRSGNVFIYEEHSSGIKRWTDGVPWSPSRILGNFLIYRELDKPFQPGEKKRAMKRHKTDGVTKPTSNSRSHSISSFGPGALASQTMTAGGEHSTVPSSAERAYLGSLIDSYQFKDDGLLKKTISITHKGVQHHLVSYYNLDDVMGGKLHSVRETPELRGITPSQSILGCGSFRGPIDDVEYGVMDPRQYALSQQLAAAGSMDFSSMHTMASTRSLPMTPTQSYGHPQAWATQQYGQNPDYAASQMVQAPPTHYRHQQMMPAYTYDETYTSSSQAPSFNTYMQPPRRHSAVPSSSGANQLGYSVASPLLTNGNNLTAHGLSNSPYLNGDIFSVSAASATAEGTQAGPCTGNNVPGTINQSNGTNGINTPVSQNASGFDGRLPNGFENSIGRLGINSFGNLSGAAGTSFEPTSPDTSPSGMTLNMDHSGMISPDIAENTESNEDEWNRTMTKDNAEW